MLLNAIYNFDHLIDAYENVNILLDNSAKITSKKCDNLI